MADLRSAPHPLKPSPRRRPGPRLGSAWVVRQRGPGLRRDDGRGDVPRPVGHGAVPGRDLRGGLRASDPDRDRDQRGAGPGAVVVRAAEAEDECGGLTIVPFSRCKAMGEGARRADEALCPWVTQVDWIVDKRRTSSCDPESTMT